VYGGEQTEKRQSDCRKGELLRAAPVCAALEEEQRLGAARNLRRRKGASGQTVKPVDEQEEDNAPWNKNPRCGKDIRDARGARKPGDIAVRDIQAEETTYYAHVFCCVTG
jgi:hypothetical protein